MNLKIMLLIAILYSVIFLNGCGRKEAPVKPTEISIRN